MYKPYNYFKQAVWKKKKFDIMNELEPVLVQIHLIHDLDLMNFLMS